MRKVKLPNGVGQGLMLIKQVREGKKLGRE